MKCECFKNEKLRFVKAIKMAKFSREKAAKILKISRATFFRRAKELGLTHIKPDFDLHLRKE